MVGAWAGFIGAKGGKTKWTRGFIITSGWGAPWGASLLFLCGLIAFQLKPVYRCPSASAADLRLETYATTNQTHIQDNTYLSYTKSNTTRVASVWPSLITGSVNKVK
jgi:hypothetical protein